MSWISVKDALPKPHTYVLTYTPPDDLNGCPCRILDISSHVGYGKSGHFPASVTHWMPLPATPSKKGRKKTPSCDECDTMNELCGYGKKRGSQDCKDNRASF